MSFASEVTWHQMRQSAVKQGYDARRAFAERKCPYIDEELQQLWFLGFDTNKPSLPEDRV